MPRSAQPSTVPVNPERLAPNNSNGPIFRTRGYYQDEPFVCCDCGRAQVWTARKQKWWFEVFRGSVYVRPKRCRSCRQRERKRRAEARRVHQEGLAAKRPPA